MRHILIYFLCLYLVPSSDQNHNQEERVHFRPLQSWKVTMGGVILSAIWEEELKKNQAKETNRIDQRDKQKNESWAFT